MNMLENQDGLKSIISSRYQHVSAIYFCHVISYITSSVGMTQLKVSFCNFVFKILYGVRVYPFTFNIS